MQLHKLKLKCRIQFIPLVIQRNTQSHTVEGQLGLSIQDMLSFLHQVLTLPLNFAAEIETRQVRQRCSNLLS